MTPARLKQIRASLGLTLQGLADSLRMGECGGRTIRRWEAGEYPVPGPASVALEFMAEYGVKE